HGKEATVATFINVCVGRRLNKCLIKSSRIKNKMVRDAYSLDYVYEQFGIPDDIGGRFSVMTAVGLLPIAVAGIDINKIMKGIEKAYYDLNTADLDKNAAYAYAVARRILENQGKDAEMLVSYESQMSSFAEWWKQLFGESEGKDGKGVLPCSANFSTDLHSLGQFIQDGKKMLFETLILVEQPSLNMI
ncbi:MAG: hypothetical protein RR274_06965, partial [Erysipelotrichaceae bacterium]